MLPYQFTLTGMGGFASTHQFDQTVSVSLGAILSNTFTQGPALVFGECAADVFLDAYFQSAAHQSAAHCDTDVLLAGDSVGDAVDSMGGVLSAASFWGGFLHFHSNII